MKITSYNLCDTALGEILGGEIQFSVDALTSILTEQEELVKSLKMDYFRIVKLLNINNESLKELEKKLDEYKDMNLDNAKEGVICWDVVNSIDRFVQHFEWSVLFLKELKNKADIFKKKTNEDTTELELLIESALKKISKNYEDGLFEKVNERKKALKEQIELLKKSNKR